MKNTSKKSPEKQSKNSKTKKTSFSIGYLLLFLVALYIIQMFMSPKAGELTYSQFREYLSNGKIVDCTIGEKVIKGHYESPISENNKPVAFVTVPVQNLELVSELEAKNVKFKGEVENNFLRNMIMWWIFPFLIIGIAWFFISKRIGGMGSPFASFGKAKIKLYAAEDAQKITFDNVAGCDEAKEELGEIIEFLKYPQKFQKLGGKIPKGVLLVGPPGTGKTLLAKAVAGESGVPFFSISGSDFVEMFVGMGAARVRDMFAQAKQKSPCIVFIDELDSVGRQRGAGLGGGHDEREQTLNQLLAEMDGFTVNSGVIIIAATNRPDVLDNALLRPGRFDRHITVDRPDLVGREDILKVHAKDVKMEANGNLNIIAKRTPGFSGADLANVINEAALLAARRDKEFVEMAELEESIERVIAGPERKSRVISDKEKEIVAYHESGHTLVAAILPNADPVHKVSIIARGAAALGYTLQLPTEDKYLTRESEILDTLCVLLAGRAAEDVIFNELSTGAQNDLERVTKLARNLICKFGMSSTLGPQTFGRQQGNVFLGHDLVQEKEFSEKTAIEIDAEVTKIIKNSYNKAKCLIEENKDKLVLLAKKLEEEEVLEAEQILELLNLKEKNKKGPKEDTLTTE